MGIQRILIGLDGSPLAEKIVPYVMTLAKGLGANITLVQVLDNISDNLDERERSLLFSDLLERAGAKARAYLEGVRQQIRDAGISVDVAVPQGEAATALAEYAEHEHIDLIALATHGRSGPQRWLYGNIAEKVLHTSRVPVLLLRPDEDQTAVFKHIWRIVVPLDGSPLAEAALPTATRLAKAFKSPLVLLRAVEIPAYALGDITVGVYTDYDGLMKALTEEAQNYLADMVARLHGEGVNAQAEIVTGFASGEIIAYAEEHEGSLVVMSTHGRSGIVGVLLGSVARRVMRAAIPTITVYPVPVPAVVV